MRLTSQFSMPDLSPLRAATSSDFVVKMGTLVPPPQTQHASLGFTVSGRPKSSYWGHQLYRSYVSQSSPAESTQSCLSVHFAPPSWPPPQWQHAVLAECSSLS